MTHGPAAARMRIHWVRGGASPRPLPRRRGLAARQGSGLAFARRRERACRAQREQLIHLARVSLLGELSAALVHELNQPLAAVLANARHARRSIAAPAASQDTLGEILDDIVEASQRAAAIIQRMRALFLRRETRQEPVDLNAVTRDALGLARSSLAGRGVRLALALDPHALPLRGDPVQLQQVSLNLILNACDAMDANPPGARRLAVATAAGQDGQACLTVTDNGAGIAPALQDRIFDSFFTTKPHGLGVGLAVSREIVMAHGGRLEAANHAGGGAVFRMTLPMAGENNDD